MPRKPVKTSGLTFSQHAALQKQKEEEARNKRFEMRRQHMLMRQRLEEMKNANATLLPSALRPAQQPEAGESQAPVRALIDE